MIMAAQDKAFSTSCFQNKILKEEIDSRWRLCKQHEETFPPHLRMPHAGE
jgi:hypothetical protein